MLRGFMSIGVAQGYKMESWEEDVAVLRGFMSIGVARFEAILTSFFV